MSSPGDLADFENACTEAMCAAFWASKPRKFKEKWAIRLRTGLSSKRKFQLTRHMAEFFARQGGSMEEVAKAKRAEFVKQLNQCDADVQRCEQALGNLRASREQLRGAIEGIDRIFKAAGVQAAPERPTLTLVPPPAELAPVPEAPPTPTEPPPVTPDPELA